MLPQRQLPLFRAEVEIDQGAALLSLFGEMGPLVTGSFERGLQSLEAQVNHLVVDLRGLTAMDTAGVRVLTDAADRADSQMWRLSVVRGPDAVDTLFRPQAVESRISLFHDADGLFPPPSLT
jgi:anti-anti-sigma factor